MVIPEKGTESKLVVPQKGDKERLVELAARNAALVLTQDEEKIKREELRTIGAMNQVGSWIGLEGSAEWKHTIFPIPVV